MPYQPDAELATGVLGVGVGAVGAAARWFSEIMQGRARWVATHFLFVVVMGGFMGFMGAALAGAVNHPEWANVLAGALGASSAFGFDFIIKRILGLLGL